MTITGSMWQLQGLHAVVTGSIGSQYRVYMWQTQGLYVVVTGSKCGSYRVYMSMWQTQVSIFGHQI